MLAGNIPGRTVTMSIAIYDAFAAGQTQTANVLVVIFTLVSCTVLYAANRLGRTIA
jgi:molybdate transport system permease protein